MEGASLEGGGLRAGDIGGRGRVGVGWCTGPRCDILVGVARGRGGMVGPAPPPMMLSILKLTLGLGDRAPMWGAGAGDMAPLRGEWGAR